MSAAVHSLARRRSKSSEQPAITVQYAIPAYIGDTSPDVTATMTSSSTAMPAGPWPCMTRHMPWPRRDIVSRSASLKRLPTMALSAKMRPRPLRVSAPHLRKGVPGARPGLFCTLAAAFQYASTAREPSQPRRGLASEHQTRPDQEGVPGGTLRIVATDGFVVGACPRECGFLLMAGQVGGESRASRDRRDRAA